MGAMHFPLSTNGSLSPLPYHLYHDVWRSDFFPVPGTYEGL